MKSINLSTLTRTLMITGLIIFFLGSNPVQASTTVYRVSQDGINDGLCGTAWESSCSLQQALRLSVAGDQIWVKAGTYKPTNTADRTISFALKSGVAIYGGFDGTETDVSQRSPVDHVTILSGDIGLAGNSSDNSYHVVYSYNVDAATSLDGFTISGGNANGQYPYSRGGGIFNYAGNLSLANVVLTGNQTIDLGGGMYNYGGNPTLEHVDFQGNIATQRGGGIYNYSSHVVMNSITFTENIATKEMGGGMNSFDSTSVLTDVVFTRNSAGTSGGGLFSFGGSVTVTNATFTENTAKGGAGMYNSTNSTASLTNIEFINNSASERAGGFYNYLSEANLTQVTFENNYALQHGGGMFTGDSNPVLENVQFIGNKCDNNGGGLNNNNSNPLLTNVEFLNNQAVNGGGIFNWDYSSPVMENVTFRGNSASLRGGGMYSVTQSNYQLNNVIFDSNTSGDYGGGAFTDSSTTTLNNVTFSANTAKNRGGGLYNSGSPSTLTNVSFTDNSSYDGGGLFSSASNSTLMNVTFARNSASNRGGGLYNYLSNLSLSNLTIAGNSAKTYGGGYFNADGGFTLISGTIKDNVAGEYGGGIATDESSASIKNTILWGNRAGSGSQMHIFSAGKPVFKNVVIQKGCPSGATCSDLVTSDPLLGELGDFGGFTPTIPLQEHSSAVDAANDASCLSTDQRGASRPKGAHCDIGAYESDFDTTVELVHSPSNGDKLTDSTVTLEWSVDPQATKYKLRMSTKADFSTLVFSTKTTDNFYHYPAYLNYKTTYYWQVRPIYGEVKGAWSPVFRFLSMDPLAAPSTLSQTIVGSGVTLSWAAVENASQYQIQVSKDSTFTNKVKGNTADLKVDLTLSSGKYFCRVQAIDASGKKGPWSKVLTFKLAP